MSTARLRIATALFLLGSLAGGLNLAQAADPVEFVQPEPELIIEPSRNFSAAPYFWATFYNGTMTVQGQEVDLSGTSVFDLLREGDVNFPPLVGVFEYDAGRWGAYFDATLIGLNFSSSDIALGSGPLSATAGLDFTYALINAGLTLTLYEGDVGGFMSEVDVMPGVRYTYYDLDLSGTICCGPGPAGAAIPVSLQEKLDWLDATLGLRLRGENASNVTYSLYGDVGIGEGFSTQGVATIGKTWNRSAFDFNVFAGYRVLYQDWSSGNEAVDLTTHGPLLGMKFIF